MELLAIPLSRQKSAVSGWLSGEGRNPAVYKRAVRFCLRDAEKFLIEWIPAFAGMT